jgi:hypothetical protein
MTYRTRDYLDVLNKARGSNTPPETLRKLSTDFTWTIRYEVAINPTTPVDILDQLAEDYECQVVCGVASNPSTPVKILVKMAIGCQARHLHEVLIRNPNTPEAVKLWVKNGGSFAGMTLVEFMDKVG